MNNAKRVQIIMMTCNRLDYSIIAINSILAQTYKNYELIISDNSTNIFIVEKLKAKFPNLRIIQPKIHLSPIDHLNFVLKHADKEYLVMFHDDDVILPTYLEKMVSIMDKNKCLSAAAPNSIFINDIGKKIGFLWNGKKFDTKLISKEYLIKSYLGATGTEIATFPSYMYRLNKIKNLKFESKNGGRHSDASFLSEILKKGPIFWSSEILFQYRRHNLSSVLTEKLHHRKTLINYFRMQTDINIPEKYYQYYRYYCWWRWLNTNESNIKLSLTKKIRYRFYFGFILTIFLINKVTIKLNN